MHKVKAVASRGSGFFNFLKKGVDKYVFICYISGAVAEWFSWLERRPVTPEVEGSSPFSVAIMPLLTRGIKFADIAQ